MTILLPAIAPPPPSRSSFAPTGSAQSHPVGYLWSQHNKFWETISHIQGLHLLMRSELSYRDWQVHLTCSTWRRPWPYSASYIWVWGACAPINPISKLVQHHSIRALEGSEARPPYSSSRSIERWRLGGCCFSSTTKSLSSRSKISNLVKIKVYFIIYISATDGVSSLWLVYSKYSALS
jgi:hypothetical protein